jgi:hypothetical protein
MSAMLAIAVALAIGWVSQIEAQAPREPAAPVKNAAPAAESAKPPQFSLLGVLVSGDTRKALIYEPALTQAGGRWMQVGEQLGQYRLVAIESDRILLDDGGGNVAVHRAFTPSPSLPGRNVGPSTPATPAAAAPPPRVDPNAAPAGAPSIGAEFLASKTGASPADIEARLRASGKSWVALGQEYGFSRNTLLMEYREWMVQRQRK